jgi:hypothetical protein
MKYERLEYLNISKGLIELLQRIILLLEIYSNIPSKIAEYLRLEGYVAHRIFNEAKKAINPS